MDPGRREGIQRREGRGGEGEKGKEGGRWGGGIKGGEKREEGRKEGREGGKEGRKEGVDGSLRELAQLMVPATLYVSYMLTSNIAKYHQNNVHL